MCPKIFKPVCKGKKTFNNYCEAFCEGCSADELTECDSDHPFHNEKECKSVEECCCPLHYEPVCGSDGKIYHNYCHLTCNSCNENPAANFCGMGGYMNDHFHGHGYGHDHYAPKNPFA